MTPKELARGERLDFADFLAGLTPGQWDGPSLCAGWTVRDVAAHCVSFEGLSPARLATRFLKGRLQTDRINAIAVADLADASTEQLIGCFATMPTPHGLGAGFGGRVALTDNMIHQQDIRRPLGLAEGDPGRTPAAPHWTSSGSRRRSAVRGRPAGCRLVATDVDWSFGKGPEVRGAGRGAADGHGGPPRRAGRPRRAGEGHPRRADLDIVDAL